MRRLKDYPLNEWLEAADTCGMCGAQIHVKVTWVDESGDFGQIETKVEHEEYCADLDVGMNPVAHGFDFVGWEYSHRVITIAGRNWPTFKSRVNTGICLNCEKFVVGIPLIMWPDDGEVELNFCFKCAKELGILDLLTKQGGNVNG